MESVHLEWSLRFCIFNKLLGDSGLYTLSNQSLSKCQSLSYAQLFATPWTAAHQASLSMRFSRQEYQSGLPFPSPGVFPTQGLNLGLPHCRQILYQLSYKGSPVLNPLTNQILILISSYCEVIELYLKFLWHEDVSIRSK